MSRLNVNQIYTRTGTGSPAIREMPAFRAVQSTVQNSVQAGAVLAADTPLFDTNDYYDETNYRYLPLIPGYYWFRGHAVLQQSGTVSFQQIALRKNPTDASFTTTFSRNVHRQTIASNYYIETCGIVYMNGSTDFVDVYVNGSATTNLYTLYPTSPDVTGCFEGFLVRPD